MPVGEPKRDARLEARVPRATKALCETAAAIQGRKLTDFVVNSVVEAAQRVVRASELSELTQRDKIVFVEALLNPPAPNARLRKAAVRHAQVFGR
jgi:uncharacterized protein (DUF1778 family)